MRRREPAGPARGGGAERAGAAADACAGGCERRRGRLLGAWRCRFHADATSSPQYDSYKQSKQAQILMLGSARILGSAASFASRSWNFLRAVSSDRQPLLEDLDAEHGFGAEALEFFLGHRVPIARVPLISCLLLAQLAVFLQLIGHHNIGPFDQPLLQRLQTHPWLFELHHA